MKCKDCHIRGRNSECPVVEKTVDQNSFCSATGLDLDVYITLMECQIDEAKLAIKTCESIGEARRNRNLM